MIICNFWLKLLFPTVIRCLSLMLQTHVGSHSTVIWWVGDIKFWGGSDFKPQRVLVWQLRADSWSVIWGSVRIKSQKGLACVTPVSDQSHRECWLLETWKVGVQYLQNKYTNFSWGFIFLKKIFLNWEGYCFEVRDWWEGCCQQERFPNYNMDLSMKGNKRRLPGLCTQRSWRKKGISAISESKHQRCNSHRKLTTSSYNSPANTNLTQPSFIRNIIWRSQSK